MKRYRDRNTERQRDIREIDGYAERQKATRYVKKGKKMRKREIEEQRDINTERETESETLRGRKRQIAHLPCEFVFSSVSKTLLEFGIFKIIRNSNSWIDSDTDTEMYFQTDFIAILFILSVNTNNYV